MCTKIDTTALVQLKEELGSVKNFNPTTHANKN